MIFAGNMRNRISRHRYDEKYDSRKRGYTKYWNGRAFWSEFLLSIIGATKIASGRLFLFL